MLVSGADDSLCALPVGNEPILALAQLVDNVVLLTQSVDTLLVDGALICIEPYLEYLWLLGLPFGVLHSDLVSIAAIMHALEVYHILLHPEQSRHSPDVLLLQLRNVRADQPDPDIVDRVPLAERVQGDLNLRPVGCELLEYDIVDATGNVDNNFLLLFILLLVLVLELIFEGVEAAVIGGVVGGASVDLGHLEVPVLVEVGHFVVPVLLVQLVLLAQLLDLLGQDLVDP